MCRLSGSGGCINGMIHAPISPSLVRSVSLLVAEARDNSKGGGRSGQAVPDRWMAQYPGPMALALGVDSVNCVQPSASTSGVRRLPLSRTLQIVFFSVLPHMGIIRSEFHSPPSSTVPATLEITDPVTLGLDRLMPPTVHSIRDCI